MIEEYQKRLDKIDTSRWEFQAQYILRTISERERKTLDCFQTMLWLQKILKRMAQEAYVMGYHKARDEMQEAHFSQLINTPDFLSVMYHHNENPIKIEDDS